MMLNGVELLLFISAVEKLTYADFTKYSWGKIIESCGKGVVFSEHHLDEKKNQGFLTILVVFFMIGLKVKALTNDEECSIYNDAFLSLLSPEAFQLFQVFMDENPKLSTFNLITLNDISKRLDAKLSVKVVEEVGKESIGAKQLDLFMEKHYELAKKRMLEFNPSFYYS